jgi:transposase InsO family protein
MKFVFIDAEKANFPVRALCRILRVSRQGYYAFAKRPPSARSTSDSALRARVTQVHDESAKRYGSPRVLHELRRQGLRVGKRRVERTMRNLGLVARPMRRFRVTTQANPAHAIVPNVLDRNFTASRPNERWVTDISYVSSDEGWCYLAVIIDLFSRAVVGWALDATLSTSLPLAALDMALRRRRPEGDLLHHSDRGCQYTSAEYRSALAERGVTVSMSRKGNCWDNAVMERFFLNLKMERVWQRDYANAAEAIRDVADYIVTFYNNVRLHSTLGYLPPNAYELKSAAQSPIDVS